MKPDKQFKRAQDLNAAFTVKVESDSSVRLRNLKTREERLAAAAEIIPLIAPK
jgi:hypothetical protein